MSESTPHFAPIVVLLFLGSILLTGFCLLVLFYGAVRRSTPVLRASAAAIFTIVVGYTFILGGVSLASSKKTIPPGGSKYFCEIDCHIAYSVSGIRTASVLGPELQPTTAHGQFVIVRLRTWFDPSTISPRRGDGPLTPNARRATLLDSVGNHYTVSELGHALLTRLDPASTALTTPLRPGQSYTTDIVFDVPKDAHGFRLLLSEDDPETLLVIGHENSILHKKIYFALDSAPLFSSTTR
jgi:hypothetical protein